MNDNPAFLLLMTAIGLYVLHMWRQDYQAAKSGQPNPGALPGATPSSVKACVIAAAGALVILTIETAGEIRLGLSEEQSTITVFFGIYTLMAAFIEELIFRGFIVVDGRGKILRWAGILGASIIFAALHPFLWEWDMSGAPAWQLILFWRWDEWLTLTLTPKAWFSTAIVFASSLWFYAVRFGSFNPNQSLLPCIVAHATKNLGVFGIKLAQGFVVGWA